MKYRCTCNTLYCMFHTKCSCFKTSVFACCYTLLRLEYNIVFAVHFITLSLNLQLKSSILTVATAGVTFTDPAGSVGSSTRDKVRFSSSTPSGTSSIYIGNVKVCHRFVPLNILLRIMNFWDLFSAISSNT